MRILLQHISYFWTRSYSLVAYKLRCLFEVVALQLHLGEGRSSVLRVIATFAVSTPAAFS